MIEIIEKIISWASAHPDIRALILEGSMVSGQETDELSDYDLNFYMLNPDVFAEHNEWLYQFDDVIVYQKPDFMYEQSHIPSRLVVYENSPRVDFSFWNVDILKKFVQKQHLPEFYKNGYGILLDKDGLASKLPEPTHDGYIISKPSKDELLKTIYDFWYEAYCVAKYLKRGSLFYAKMVENGYIKKFLFQMLLWHEAVNIEWGRNDIHLEGKNLEKKFNERIQHTLSRFFSVYSRDETLQSLQAMTDYYQKISYVVCEKIEIEYPKIKIENIKKYISKIT